MADEMLNAALSYAARGWPVLPLKESSKEPLTENGFKNASTDEGQIRQWWLKYPKANIGVCVGIDSNLLVLDIDNHKGKAGSVSFAHLADHLGIFDAYKVHTANDGIHCYFPFPDELKGKPIKKQLAEGVDVKYNGYVVAPPSRINGNFYTHRGNGELTPMPSEWITEHIKRETLVDWERTKRDLGDGETICAEYDISLDAVLDIPAGARRTPQGYQFAHPVHGSSTGINFSVNMDRGLWHCFRCDSGGDALSWFAVSRGLVSCEDANHLDKETVKRCLALMREEGLVPEEPTIFRSSTQGEQDGSDPAAYFDKKTFVRKRLADEIADDFHFLTFTDTREIYVYNHGIYEPGGEAVIREEALKRLGELSNDHRVSNTISQIRDSHFVKREEVETPINLIPAANNVLNTETWQLEDYTPEVPIFLRHRGGYYPELLENPPGEALKFITSIFPEDELATIQEFCGACLWRANLYKKALMLIGDGDNGKSLFLTLLGTKLGRDAVSTRSLYDLANNRFAPADLYHKTANINADVGKGDLLFLGRFMMLTGGDRITAEHKGVNAFNFVNYAVLIFSTNALPFVKNDFPQFYERWILAEMPYRFVDNPVEDEGERQIDPFLEEKITTPEELSWFFTWSIEGLKRLLTNGRFTESDSAKNVMNRWKSKTDSLQSFVMERVESNLGSRVTKNALYETYQAYCRDLEKVPMSKEWVGRHLPDYISTQTVETRPRSWAHIIIKGEESLDMPKGQDERLDEWDEDEE